MTTATEFEHVEIFCNNQPKEVERWGMRRYKYTVGYRTNKGSGSFPFYASASDFDRGKNRLTEVDLLEAFQCYCEDAWAAHDGPSEWADNFGMSEYPFGEAMEMWEACKSAHDELIQNGVDPDADWEFIDRLRDEFERRWKEAA